MKLSDGLFLDCFRKVAGDYPDIAADDRIVDALCMQLVMQPETFDVLLLENLYGDIVSDLAAGLVGGLGVVPGANLGSKAAIFEAVHGTAPDIAGQDKANPTALLMSAILMLRYLELGELADRVEAALLATLKAGIKTPDIGGSAGTMEFTKAIAARL
jgi:isocitrate dehydrogenase (NAD+)